MRVAMIVHNTVMSDVRVLKEARSLWACGFNVEVHGVSSDNEDHEDVLPGSDVRVFLASLTSGSVTLRAGPGAGRRYLVSAVAVVLAPVALSAAGGRRLGQLIGRSMPGVRRIAPLRYVWAIVSRFARGVRRRALKLRRWLIKRVLRSESRWAAAAIRARYNTLGTRLVESVVSRPAPDIVHIHDHIALTGARWLKENLGCTIVWDAHEIYESLGVSDKARLMANRRVIREMHPYVDHFVTINDSIADFYRQQYPALGHATVVMNAKPRGEPVDYDGRLHDAAGLPRERRILLFQGGFAGGRGLHALIRSAASLRPDWSLVMMGWGGLEQELRALAAAEVGDTDRVVFLPGAPQHELGAWTRGATLGAIPYEDIGLNHRYCTPNKLWEYPEAGVPILCTDLEELGKIVRANEIGFVLPREFDGNAIARVVNDIDDTALATSRAACARFIDSNHWDIFGERLCDLYDRIAGRARSAGVDRDLDYTGTGLT